MGLVQEAIEHINSGKTQSTIFGNFEILFQRLSLDEQLKELENEPDFSNTEDRTVAVWFAGLAEYLCNLKGIEPFKWTEKEEYFFDEITYTRDLVEASKDFNMESIKRTAIEKALPEFKRRNYIVCGVLNQV